MGPLHAAARCLVAQLGEVDVEVVVRRLVVEVDSQLAGWKAVALQDGLLSHNETRIIILSVCLTLRTPPRLFHLSIIIKNCVLSSLKWKVTMTELVEDHDFNTQRHINDSCWKKRAFSALVFSKRTPRGNLVTSPFLSGRCSAAVVDALTSGP